MQHDKSVMLDLVAQYQKSGLSLVAFCREHGISKSTFHYWLKKESAPDTGGFIAIHPRPVAGNAACQPHQVELSFPNGVTLRTGSDNLTLIASLIRLV